VRKLERNDNSCYLSPPYVSAFVSRSAQDQLDVKFLPSLEEGENLEYTKRVALGFRLAMREGMDYFMGLASVLARMGEQFEQQSGSTKLSKELLDPATLWHSSKQSSSAAMHKRNILPKISGN
jgi:hypothetical protein